MRLVLLAAMGVLLGACAQTHRPDFEARGATYKVSGVVRSAEGRPIPYATLTAMSGGGGCLVSTFDERSTDDFGRYTLEVPYLTRIATIHVRAPGWSSRAYDLKRDETGVDFSLTPGVEQQGVVIDAHGRPLEDVVIRAKAGTWTWSDKAGHFVLRSMDSGETELTAEHRDHPTLTQKLVAPATGLQLTLADGVRLRVIVQGRDHCFPLSNEHPAKPIDERTFELVGLAGDQPFELTLACSESDQTISFRRTLQPPLPESVTIEPTPLRAVRLELVEEAGRPAAGTMFLFETQGDPSAEARSILMTNDAGVASLLIPQGPRVLQIMTIPTGHFARRWWHGEEVVRLTLPSRATTMALAHDD